MCNKDWLVLEIVSNSLVWKKVNFPLYKKKILKKKQLNIYLIYKNKLKP